MWISRKLFDELVELRQDLSAALAEADAVRSQVAGKDRTIEWLTTYVNDLRVERAALFERVLNLKMPSPEFVQAEPAPVAAQIPDLSNVPPEARVVLEKYFANRRFRSVDDQPAANPLDTLGELGAAMFDDVGDDKAKQLGIRHNEAGEVTYG